MKSIYRLLVLLIIGLPLILLNLVGKILHKVGEILENGTLEFNGSKVLKYILDIGRE